MNKYLATDLDGTLLEPKSVKNYVCSENKNTLKLFKENIFIISGRNQQFIKKVCKELKIPHTFIGCNGAIIYVNGKRIFTSYLENKTLIHIIDYVKQFYKNYHMIFIDDKGRLYSLYDNEKNVLDAEKKMISMYPKLAYVTNKKESAVYKLLKGKNKIIKMNLNIEKDAKKEIYHYLKNENLGIKISICNNSLEITNEGINKGLSLKRLTSKLNINDDDVYVVGDDGNDVSMFELYKNSFLIKNKHNKELVNTAKYTLNSFDELENYMEEK